MIPAVNSSLLQGFTLEAGPSVNYRMYLYEEVVNGTCDRLKAMEQVVFKILSTERYKYAIYSWNYGIELKDLFGMPVSYVCPELERRIREALMQDDRIRDVHSFEFSFPKRHEVFTTFTVATDFGALDMVKAVQFG